MNLGLDVDDDLYYDGWDDSPYPDYYEDDFVVELEECWHHPIGSTQTCYYCEPDAVAWDIEDAWLAYEGSLSLMSEADIYRLISLSPDEELELKLLDAGIIANELRPSARGRRQQWYRPGNKPCRRRQDHGTAHAVYRRDDYYWYKSPSRQIIRRGAIGDSLGLNTITAEFELNYEPVGGDYDEDYAKAVNRLEARRQHTRRHPSFNYRCGEDDN